MTWVFLLCTLRTHIDHPARAITQIQPTQLRCLCSNGSARYYLGFLLKGNLATHIALNFDSCSNRHCKSKSRTLSLACPSVLSQAQERAGLESLHPQGRRGS